MTSLWRHSRLTCYDLGPNLLTQGVELLAGEVWQVSKRNSQYFRSYLRKTTGGGAFGPPSGARVKGRVPPFLTQNGFHKSNPISLRPRSPFSDIRVQYRIIASQSWTLMPSTPLQIICISVLFFGNVVNKFSTFRQYSSMLLFFLNIVTYFVLWKEIWILYDQLFFRVSIWR